MLFYLHFCHLIIYLFTFYSAAYIWFNFISALVFAQFSVDNFSAITKPLVEKSKKAVIFIYKEIDMFFMLVHNRHLNILPHFKNMFKLFCEIKPWNFVKLQFLQCISVSVSDIVSDFNYH